MSHCSLKQLARKGYTTCHTDNGTPKMCLLPSASIKTPYHITTLKTTKIEGGFGFCSMWLSVILHHNDTAGQTEDIDSLQVDVPRPLDIGIGDLLQQPLLMAHLPLPAGLVVTLLLISITPEHHLQGMIGGSLESEGGGIGMGTHSHRLNDSVMFCFSTTHCWPVDPNYKWSIWANQDEWNSCLS